MSTASIPDARKTETIQREDKSHKYRRCLQHKVFQITVFTLLATMALCVISITALYLVNLKEDDFGLTPENSSEAPLQTSAWTSTVLPTSPPGPWPRAVDFCDLLYCDQVYCCPSGAEGSTDSNITISKSPEIPDISEKRGEDFYGHLKHAGDWTNTTIHSIMIKENQQVIDSKYCLRDECGPNRYIFRVPISEFVPVNMRVTLLMNSTELLVILLCSVDESAVCSVMLDMNTESDSRYPSNTQGEHEWPLPVARFYQSSYHFRATVAGQADCSTDHHYAGVLFTDYYFYFYRQCTDS